MVDLTFKYEMVGREVSIGELDDHYEAAMLLAEASDSARQHVQHKLGALRCPDHDQPPRVTVTLSYSEETGQTDLSYHMDTCCQRLLLDSVRLLHR